MKSVREDTDSVRRQSRVSSFFRHGTAELIARVRARRREIDKVLKVAPLIRRRDCGL